MAKSQEDNETIEQAIDRIVAEHEHEPTAHTGENESLAAHRENEVLDHLAGSVVADKLSGREIVFGGNFQNESVLTTAGQVNVSMPITTVNGDWELGNASYLRFFGPTLVTQFRLVQNTILRSCMALYNYNDNGFAQFGFTNGTTLQDSTVKKTGIYMSLENGVLKGRIYYTTGGTTVDEVVTLMTYGWDEEYHIFEIRISADENMVYFVLDNVVLGEIATAGMPSTAIGPQITFRAYSPNENDQNNLEILNYFYSSALPNS